MRASRRKDFWVVVCCLIAAAIWIDFSSIHRFHNSDSLVMTLISIYQWTPLYWGQDRLGMLFPLLASPWEHPLANLLAQGVMTTLVALSSFFLLGYYVAGRRRGITIGALGGIFLMVFTRANQRFDYLIYIHQFATSAAFGIAGLILLDLWSHGRTKLWAVAGVSLIAIAHWLNPAIALAIGPLLLVRGLTFRGLGDYFDQLDEGNAEGQRESLGSHGNQSEYPSATLPSATFRWCHWRVASAQSLSHLEEHWQDASGTGQVAVANQFDGLRLAWFSKDELVGLVAIFLSLVGNVAFSHFASDRQPYGFLPPGEWLACAVEVWKHLGGGLRPMWFHTVEITAIVGLATLYWPAGRAMARISLRMAGGLLFAAAVQYAFMTSLDHVHRTHYPRYAAVAVFFWQTALIGFTVVQCTAVLPSGAWLRRMPAMLTVAMAVLTAIVHGPVSPRIVRAEIDAVAGRYTDDLLAAGCTHMTGDYWHVWPAMFHANLRLTDEHSPKRVWAIAQRCGPTEKFWRQIPWTEMRIAEIVGDEQQSLEYRQRFRLPPVAAREQVGSIRVLCPTGPADGVEQMAGHGTERK